VGNLRAGKVSEAMGLMAPVEGYPDQRTRERLEYLAEDLAAGRWDIAVLDAVQFRDYAVVVTHERIQAGKPARDLDPVFLVRAEGIWRLSPQVDDYQCLVGPRGEGRAELDRLAQWFRKRVRRRERTTPR